MGRISSAMRWIRLCRERPDAAALDAAVLLPHPQIPAGSATATPTELPAPARPSLPSWAELIADARYWMRTQGRWYAASAAVHFLALVCLLLLPVAVLTGKPDAAPSFVSPEVDRLPSLDLTHFNLGKPPLDPTELDPRSLVMLEPPGHDAQFNDNSPIFREAGGGTPQGASDQPPGGLGGFNVRSFAAGSRVTGGGGIGTGLGTGTHPGSGGTG